MQWGITIVMIRLKRSILKKYIHNNVDDRNILRIRDNVTFGGMLLYSHYVDISENDKIVPFLREIEWRTRFDENVTEFVTIIKWI